MKGPQKTVDQVVRGYLLSHDLACNNDTLTQVNLLNMTQKLLDISAISSG